MLAVRQKKKEFKYFEDYMTVILFPTKSQPLQLGEMMFFYN